MTNLALTAYHSNDEHGKIVDEKKPKGSLSSSMKADTKQTVNRRAVENPSNSEINEESKNEEQQTKQKDNKKVSSSA